jgi:hypothetical protein
MLRENTPAVREEAGGCSDMIFPDAELIGMLTRALAPYPEARRAVVRELWGNNDLPDVPL